MDIADDSVVHASILKPQDIKPFPVLWHEDNRRHQARDRPQVFGALSGHLLGEAAHRLVKNSLQIKSNHNTGLLGTPYRNSPYVVDKPRPAGPLGYERGFQDSSYYHHASPNPRAFPNSHPVQLFSENRISRQNFRLQDRPNQDQYYNIRSDLSNLTIEERAGVKPNPRMPNAGFWQNEQQTAEVWQNQQQHMQSPGPPPAMPPTNWIDRQPMTGYASGFNKQEISTRSLYNQQQQQQQGSRVYRIRSQIPQNTTDLGNQQ